MKRNFIAFRVHVWVTILYGECFCSNEPNGATTDYTHITDTQLHEADESGLRVLADMAETLYGVDDTNSSQSVNENRDGVDSCSVMAEKQGEVGDHSQTHASDLNNSVTRPIALHSYIGTKPQSIDHDNISRNPSVIQNGDEIGGFQIVPSRNGGIPLGMNEPYESLVKRWLFNKIMKNLSPNEKLFEVFHRMYQDRWAEFADYLEPQEFNNVIADYRKSKVAEKFLQMLGYLESSLMFCQRILGIQNPGFMGLHDFYDFLRYINEFGRGAVLSEEVCKRLCNVLDDTVDDMRYMEELCTKPGVLTSPVVLVPTSSLPKDLSNSVIRCRRIKFDSSLFRLLPIGPLQFGADPNCTLREELFQPGSLLINSSTPRSSEPIDSNDDPFQDPQIGSFLLPFGSIVLGSLFFASNKVYPFLLSIQEIKLVLTKAAECAHNIKRDVIARKRSSFRKVGDLQEKNSPEKRSRTDDNVGQSAAKPKMPKTYA